MYPFFPAENQDRHKDYHNRCNNGHEYNYVKWKFTVTEDLVSSFHSIFAYNTVCGTCRVLRITSVMRVDFQACRILKYRTLKIEKSQTNKVKSQIIYMFVYLYNLIKKLSGKIN